MQNLQHAMKMAHKILKESPSITYKSNQFHFCCGADKFKADTLEEVQDYIIQRLYKFWFQHEFTADKSVNMKISIPKKEAQVLFEDGEAKAQGQLMQTRQKWSTGKAGDPRPATHGNRKTKRFSKTNVVAWMRQRVNGRFSSEKLTREQYCKEFLAESTRAEQRRNWRAKSGKKASYTNKIIGVG